MVQHGKTMATTIVVKFVCPVLSYTIDG